MHPILFQFGKLTIFTYGFFLALGFLAAILLAKREARRVGADSDRILDLVFYVLIAAIVGSRLFYIFTNPAQYLADPLEIIKIWKGGLVFYGGFIGALTVALIYLRHAAMPVWPTADILSPSLAAGQFLGRIGCFFAGCCYGRVCDYPWAVTFTHPDSLAPVGVPLHPTQLYHAAANLTIFILLFAWRRRKRFDGQLFWGYVLLYGIGRVIIEVFRGDFRGPSLGGVLSISQVVGIVMIVVAVVMLRWLSRRARSV